MQVELAFTSGDDMTVTTGEYPQLSMIQRGRYVV